MAASFHILTHSLFTGNDLQVKNKHINNMLILWLRRTCAVHRLGHDCLIAGRYLYLDWSQTCKTVQHTYRIFSNLIRTSFCRFLKRKKKLVSGSNPHLSFSRPLRATPSEVARWVSAAWKAIDRKSVV